MAGKPNTQVELGLAFLGTILKSSKVSSKRQRNPTRGHLFEFDQHAQGRAEVVMEEKKETLEPDQEDLEFERDALDRWQDDGGR